MGTDLKPCPFCGYQAEIDSMTPFRKFLDGEISYGISVSCLSCTAEIMICREDVPEVSIEMVAELWNQRV